MELKVYLETKDTLEKILETSRKSLVKDWNYEKLKDFHNALKAYRDFMEWWGEE